MMKKLIYLFLPIAMVSCGGGEESEETTDESTEEVTTEVEEVEEDKPDRKSPRMNESFGGDGLDLTIDYGSPRVKERAIWGELVKYDEVWRAGADEVTAITFGQDVSVAGNPVTAGTYGFFIIPKEGADWTFILNEEWSKEEHDVWGSYDYNEDKDVLRFDVSVEWMEASVEELIYDFVDGNFIFEWEKAHCEFPIALQEPA